MAETFWLRSSSKHRKALYRVAKSLADSRDIKIRDLLKMAIGWEPDEHTGYQDNFRAGRISRKKCAQLYLWMRDTHPEFAQRLNEELGIIKPPTRSARPDFYFSRHRPGFNTCICSICSPKPRGKQDAWEILRLDEY